MPATTHDQTTNTGAHVRRPKTAMIASALGLIAMLLILAVGASADTLTGAADLLRTGWYGDEPALTPAAVSGSNFGQLFSTAITGQVYAQPLVVGNTLLVATETNDVYGIDPASGAIRWHHNFGVPWNPNDAPCTDLTPDVGITGTPTIDPATGTAYFLSKTYVSGSTGPVKYVAHAIDVATGTERPGWPTEIKGTASNAPGATFDPTFELQRTGLLLMNGVVYAGFGSVCDLPPWRGYVVGIGTDGVQKTLWSAESAAGNGAGIWMAGSPLMSDGPGQILVATSNGETLPPVGNSGLGSTPATGFSESMVRLGVQGDGSLKATDFFTPYNAETLDPLNLDFGASGVVGLPDSFGTTKYPHLLVVSGKEGYVYLLDRSNLGGRGNGVDHVLGKFGPFGGVWSKPAVWPGDGGYIWLPTATPSGGTDETYGYLKVYKRVLDGAGNPALSLVATSSDVYGFGSSAPIVTSDGTNSGSALVWIVHTNDGSGAGAELRAYDAAPTGGALTLRFHTAIGIASKFTPPVADNGRIFVGTRDGHVLGFGLLHTSPALSGLSPTSGPVGTSAQISATGFAASHALTVTVGGVAAQITSGGTSDPSGASTIRFAIPSVAAGPEAVVVSDGTHSVQSATSFSVSNVISLSDLGVTVRCPSAVRIRHRYACTAKIVNFGPSPAVAAVASLYELRSGHQFGRMSCTFRSIPVRGTAACRALLTDRTIGRHRIVAHVSSVVSDRRPANDTQIATVRVTR
jgi:hypothetical protein